MSSGGPPAVSFGWSHSAARPPWTAAGPRVRAPSADESRARDVLTVSERAQASVPELIGALGWFALSYMRRRQAAAQSGYAMAGGGYGGGPAPRDDAAVSARYGAGPGEATATLEPPAGPSDLERGIGHLRQMDPSFDPRAFAETASDTFFKVQGAWTARDLRSVSPSLTPEMQAQLQRDCDRLRAEQKINRLENIAVRTAEITEAWQETGQDYVTVHFLASLLDYTTDESGARVLDGSRTEPVKFEEYWTFVRPVGPGPFRLSAIQQA